jgi:hypothetical protein
MCGWGNGCGWVGGWVGVVFGRSIVPPINTPPQIHAPEPLNKNFTHTHDPKPST